MVSRVPRLEQFHCIYTQYTVFVCNAHIHWCSWQLVFDSLMNVLDEIEVETK